MHSPARAPAQRSLAPREHGAYGQLMMPLLAALVMARPTLPAVAITAAGLAAFFAHEPVMVLLGQRGERARREVGGRAVRRLLVLGAVAAALGALGFALAPAAARLSFLLPVVLTAALVPFIVRKAEKTAVGEVLAAAALSSAAVPVALASGLAPGAAYGAWLSWSLAFASTTFAVRNVVAHARAKVPLGRRLLAPAITMAVAALLSQVGWIPTFAIAATIPMLALSAFLAARPPAPTALKRVGWTLVAGSVLLAAILAFGALTG